MRIDTADNKRLVVLHPLPAVLSIREGGPVGKGGQNSDEALVASRFLSGHAPPDPAALMGDQRRPAQSRQVPTNDTERGSIYAQVRPRTGRLTASSLFVQQRPLAAGRHLRGMRIVARTPSGRLFTGQPRRDSGAAVQRARLSRPLAKQESDRGRSVLPRLVQLESLGGLSEGFRFPTRECERFPTRREVRRSEGRQRERAVGRSANEARVPHLESAQPTSGPRRRRARSLRHRERPGAAARRAGATSSARAVGKTPAARPLGRRGRRRARRGRLGWPPHRGVVIAGRDPWVVT
jgi:hypothetical protein